MKERVQQSEREKYRMNRERKGGKERTMKGREMAVAERDRIKGG